ncbi:nacht and tpr domain containing protein [Apiospora marii]|uniref:Nacht and tpr domain containing protein n=1 Tax=Apiospora marii TaxID=335849 RepID=A0ABR1RG67_9PEZI
MTDAKEEELTGKSLDGPIRSLEDVQAEIESRSQLSSGDAPVADEKWDKEKFKGAGLKVLQCLKMLVGAATQLSGMLPIPSGPVANMCANALIMAMDIPQAIHDFNNAIGDVFTKVSSVLSQFWIYERLETVDMALARQIHQVMISFVTICAHVVNYQQGGRWERFKLKTKKAILDDDSGLKAEMSNFEMLAQQQRDVEGTVVLEVVMTSRKIMYQMLAHVTDTGKRVEDIQGKVTRLDQDATERKEEKDRTKKLVHIKETLGVDPNVRLNTNTTLTCTNIYTQCFAGTGSWVWDHPLYKEWTAKANKSPALLLSGDSSSGKTLIAAMITKRLEDQKRTRIFVAHYFFPPSTKKSDDEKYPVQYALKYMAFQLARVDPKALNSLYKACDNPEERVNFRPITDLKKLWAELKVGSLGLGATYHLVFDGLEHLKEKDAKDLMEFALEFKPTSDPAGSRVRVLLSGSEKVFKSDPGVDSALRIDVSNHTVPDMEIFINNKLNERGILQNAKPGSKQEQARELILKELPHSVKGNYSLLQDSLDNIVSRLSQLNTGAGLKELQEMLKKSNNSHEASIQRLQSSLSPDEIRDLNELLKWVVFGEDTVTLDELEAAMSLATLKYIIQTKYSVILKLENNFVMVQDEVRQILLRAKDSRHKLSSQKGPTISMSITINNVDQELCQHFLWDLAQKSIRDKFKFDFDSSSNRLLGSQTTIGVDEFEAHHSIVKHALNYLADEPINETRAIGKYLVTWLPVHLKRLQTLELEDKGELSPMEKRNIVDGLYSIFKSDDLFRRHRVSFEGDWSYWYAREMREVNEWFMDSSAVRRLDKQWLREVKSAPNPTKGYLRPLVNFLLTQLLREKERTWKIASAYRWIEQFVLLDTKPRKKDEEEDDNASTGSYSFARFDIDWWRQVSQWCQNYLGLPDNELDSLWYDRFGETAAEFLPFGDTSEAISEFYLKAISLPDCSWRSFKGLGDDKLRRDEVEEAIANVKKALELAQMPTGTSPPASLKDIIGLQLQLGDLYCMTNSYEEATGHYRSAQSSCPRDDTILASKADARYLKVRLHTLDAPATRQLLRDTLDGEDGQAHFVAFLKELARDDSHDAITAKIFTVSKTDISLFRGIARALDAATAMTDKSTRPETTMDSNDKFAEAEARGILLFDLGLMAYHYKIVADVDLAPNVEAAKLWKECRELLSNVGGERADTTRDAATTALSKYYFLSMTEGNHLDSLEDLEKLVDAESGRFMSKPAGFLGALHSCRQDRERASRPLSRDIKLGLQILSDDIEENDTSGFLFLQEPLLRFQDFRNSVAALSLHGVPDLVTDCLSLLSDPKTAAVAKDVVNHVKSKFPDSRKQLERAREAVEHMQGILEDAALDGDTKKMYLEVQSRLEVLDGSKLKAYGDPITLSARLWCDGSKEDGRICGQKWDSGHDMFQCLYCTDVIFCEGCWKRLVLSPDAQSGVDIFACSSKHKWLKMPRTGSDLYVGPKAQNVRIPTDVRPARKMDGTGDNDDRVLEAYFDQDSEEISVQAWKERLAAEWGFSLDQIIKEMQRADSPSDSEGKEGESAQDGSTDKHDVPLEDVPKETNGPLEA